MRDATFLALVIVGVGVWAVLTSPWEPGAAPQPTTTDKPAAPATWSGTRSGDPLSTGMVPSPPVSNPGELGPVEPGAGSPQGAAGPFTWTDDPGVSPEQDTREGSLASLLLVWTVSADYTDEEWVALEAAIEREAPRLASLPVIQDAHDAVARITRQEFSEGLHAHYPSRLCTPLCPWRTDRLAGERRAELVRQRAEALAELRALVRELCMEGIIVDSMEPEEGDE